MILKIKLCTSVQRVSDMMVHLTCVSLMVLAICTPHCKTSAIPESTEHKSRVVDRPLSDKEHFTDDFEDAPHHNVEFDHEAFLGADEEKTFDQLTPEESKQRLSIIYDKIDKDSDGLVTESELTDWIRHVQTRYVWTDTERQWKDVFPESTDDESTQMEWNAYMKRTYGHEDDDLDSEIGDTGGERFDYRFMMERDKRRWAQADQDGNGLLTKKEFSDFLHPEEVEHMKDVVIDETLEDIDKDKDGKISLAEYIGDMWTARDSVEEEPEWVKDERKQFSEYRDRDNDGFMDRKEVHDWIIPDDYDHAESEAKHLIHESDGNQDGSLSKSEVLEKFDLFVGSQATDFGEALTKHDEF